MAEPDSLNDPMDSRIEYRITLRGVELRRALVRYEQQATGLCSGKAEQLVSSDVVAHPAKLAGKLREIHDRILKNWGICSLSATARSLKLWDEYADRHRGLALQFHPPTDMRAFGDMQQIVYSDDAPVMENVFDREEARERRFDLLLKKFKVWEEEEEWRLVGGDEANTARQFDPRALTGVIVGAAASDTTKELVRDMLAQRAALTKHRPVLYEATLANGGVHITTAR